MLTWLKFYLFKYRYRNIYFDRNTILRFEVDRYLTYVSMVKALAPREVRVDKNDPENCVESHADSAGAQDGDHPGKEDPLEHADVHLRRNESQSQS